MDNQKFEINNLNSRDGKTRYWWSDAKDSFYENNQLIQPEEIFESNDRKVAIYNLDSESYIYVVYSDEQAKEYTSYVVEDTISTEKNISYEEIDKFVNKLPLLMKVTQLIIHSLYQLVENKMGF